jgi:hypothetical protein
MYSRIKDISPFQGLDDCCISTPGSVARGYSHSATAVTAPILEYTYTKLSWDFILSNNYGESLIS